MSKREWKLFVEDMEFEDLKEDRKTIDAVVRNLEIIGEASKYIR